MFLNDLERWSKCSGESGPIKADDRYRYYHGMSLSNGLCTAITQALVHWKERLIWIASCAQMHSRVPHKTPPRGRRQRDRYSLSISMHLHSIYFCNDCLMCSSTNKKFQKVSFLIEIEREYLSRYRRPFGGVLCGTQLYIWGQLTVHTDRSFQWTSA